MLFSLALAIRPAYKLDTQVTLYHTLDGLLVQSNGGFQNDQACYSRQDHHLLLYI